MGQVDVMRSLQVLCGVRFESSGCDGITAGGEID